MNYNKTPFSRTASSSSMVIGLTPRRASNARSLQGDASRSVRVASYSPGSITNLSRIAVPNTFNQQDELQGLNKRLAIYLNKVKSLESTNKELQGKIHAHLAQKGNLARDWSSYEKPVVDICKQVQETNMDNAGLTLQLDNCELASDDFKVKWQSELDLRQSVEQDLNGLRKILDDTNVGRMQLESQIEALNEELSYLRKNHQEEVDELKKQIANSSVSVEVENSDDEDLGKIMCSIREEYQALADQNRKDAEECYRKKFDAASLEASKNNEALQATKNELTNIRRQIKNLEVEQRSLMAMISSLEDTLEDTDQRLAAELQALNQTIQHLEEQLADSHSRLKAQNLEYQNLLNTKMRLQAEIDTYRRLLEVEGHSQTDHFRSFPDSSTGDKKTTKKVIIISQKVINGKVVSEKQESKEILQ
ncbi:keratin, type I cytoskeletal 18-like isoform X1 [Rhincodon typus]|uniref:keratin, type I cytoskeletal 18-like isoform X1 n=1 Tax=Rhincodon typus TaxID=259920 RepID=UPI0020306E03|nr:keratin, type I cytoskeletal 18-like isoform X1 [Rhincodon typus]